MHGPAGGRGKWSQPGVPRVGWVCEGIEDLERDRAICEMCEVQEIRYVHFMAHPDYPEPLECGCDCAGYMEGDLDAAKGRDRAMKNAAARRRRWPKLKSWYLSAKGNPCIRRGGYTVTVYPKGEQWSGAIARSGEDPVFAKKLYPTKEAAQLASFDALIFIATRKAKGRPAAGT